MKKYLLATGVVLATAQLASAEVIVGQSASKDLGGGLYETTITLSDGNSTGSWAANLTLTGITATINQVKRGPTGNIAVLSQAAAMDWDGAANQNGYTAALDTWYYGGEGYTFTAVLGTGAFEGTNTLHYFIGTAAGVNWGDVDVIHLVSTAGSISIKGTVGRNGNLYTIDIPEPTSLCLLSIAGLGMLRRRRS